MVVWVPFQLFQSIYHENATNYIISGKVTARANRVHILTESEKS